MKKKILFVLSTLTGGGAERVALTFMNDIDTSKYDVALVLLQEYGEYLNQIPEHVNVHILHKKRTLFSIFSLKKTIEEIDPDIVYATLFHTSIATYFASFFSRNKKHKMILRCPTSPKRIIEEKEISLPYIMTLRYIYNRVDMVMAQTPEMKNELHQYFNVHADKIVSFLNPINYTKIDTEIKKGTNPFQKNRINLVAAGRLSPEKGFDVLIRAFKKVHNKNNAFFLNILGKDEGEYDNLMILIKDLSLENDVKLWGFQDNPYLFFYHADLFVLSSKIEGLPNAVLENLYLQKPVVATECIPFMHTLIDHGQNGYIVPVDDIDALANAILSYKDLPNNKPFSLKTGNINELLEYV